MRRSLLAAGLVAALVASACSSDDDSGAPTTSGGTDAVATSTADTTPATTADAATSTEPPATDPATGAIAWAACDEFDDPALECGTLTVPLDHAQPDGDTIDIALVRRPATGERLHAMLFNPGGPGGSGVDLIANVSGAPPLAALNERYDLIGFDPRGVDRSALGEPCIDGPTLDELLTQDPTPETDAEAQAAAELYEGALEGCQEQYGDALRLISTEETARDMDAIRAALGDEQLAFFGISYGTYLGAVYASLFPDRVSAMLLDSAFLPDGQDTAEMTRIQIVGFETSLGELFAWCSTDESCAIHGDDPGARWDALADQLDASPLEVGGRPVNLAVLGSATIASLYDDSTWSVLAEAIAAAEQGDGSILQQLADSMSGRLPDGSYSSLTTANGLISCASGIAGAPPADPVAAVAEIRAAAPRMGRIVTEFSLTDDCTPLLGGPAPEPTPIVYTGDAPIVVIGGTSDPATPYQYAIDLVAALGPAAHLVTYDGPGHGASISTPCLMEIVDALFLAGEVPAEGTVCAPVELAGQPDWWGELPVLPGVEETFTPGADVLADFGLDPEVQYVEGVLTSDDPDAVHELFTEALSGWTAGTVETNQDGLRRSTFELDGRRVDLVTLSQELLDSLGTGLVGTVVFIAGA